MSEILWLDDLDWEVSHFCDALRELGHVVELTASEDEVLRRLQSGAFPDVFIQDLGRPVSYLLTHDQKLRTFEGFLEDAGWRFYERFIHSRFPQLPVIICSNLGSDPTAKARSDAFNVRLIQKNDQDTKPLLKAVTDSLSATETLVDSVVRIPLVVGLDFDRVNLALVKHLRHNPLDLHRLTWASFEGLAELLLAELGYDVHRTQLTHDGGVDIWALHRNDLGEVLYAIDAKKYSPDRLVGPEPVRSIYGVTQMNDASVGMIITTSSFSEGARRLARQYRHRISLRDYKDLLEWIQLVAD